MKELHSTYTSTFGVNIYLKGVATSFLIVRPKIVSDGIEKYDTSTRSLFNAPREVFLWVHLLRNTADIEIIIIRLW